MMHVYVPISLGAINFAKTESANATGGAVCGDTFRAYLRIALVSVNLDSMDTSFCVNIATVNLVWQPGVLSAYFDS